MSNNLYTKNEVNKAATCIQKMMTNKATTRTEDGGEQDSEQGNNLCIENSGEQGNSLCIENGGEQDNNLCTENW